MLLLLFIFVLIKPLLFIFVLLKLLLLFIFETPQLRLTEEDFNDVDDDDDDDVIDASILATMCFA